MHPRRVYMQDNDYLLNSIKNDLSKENVQRFDAKAARYFVR